MESDGATHPFRTVLIEQQPADEPALRPDRSALVTSLLEVPPAVLMQLSASQSTIRAFFGHPRWPLGDGKLPSSDPRANAAYLRLAALAVNVLRLFARHLGEGWTLDRVRRALRLVPDPARSPLPPPVAHLLQPMAPHA
jgi:hypothetical protein